MNKIIAEVFFHMSSLDLRLLAITFDTNSLRKNGSSLDLTLRYVFASVVLCSLDGSCSGDVSLNSLAKRVPVSRPTLSKAMNDLVALGLISEVRVFGNRAKLFEVAAPRKVPDVEWDDGQGRLICGLLSGRFAEDLNYRERVALALLVSMSDPGGAVRGQGKSRLAHCLGLKERQFRNYLLALYRKGYLAGYRGGVVGEDCQPGTISLCPRKLFPHGWWHGVDLVTATNLYRDSDFLFQQRISHYLSELYPTGRRIKRAKSGTLSTSLEFAADVRTRQRGNEGKSGYSIINEYLCSSNTLYPDSITSPFLFATKTSMFRPLIDDLSVPWTGLPPRSDGLCRLIDETFFRFSCLLVEEFQGVLAMGKLRKLPMSKVRAIYRDIYREFLPLLTAGCDAPLGLSCRIWLVQQMRAALIRQALWTWCCLSAAYKRELGSNIGRLKVYRVFPRDIEKGFRPVVMWLIKSDRDIGIASASIEVNCENAFRKAIP